MILATRSTEAERMDTDCADYDDYSVCLRDLARVNTVTLTHRPMLSWLARESAGLPMISVLDVACGHGDALRRIRRWARRRGLDARLSGIDLNPWSTRAAREATSPEDAIVYHTGDVFAFHPPAPVDFIVSSQFTHHLTGEEIIRFIGWMEANASRGWFIGDLHRHILSYLGFPLLARAAGWHRFVREDGRVSIARSFVRADWRSLLAEARLGGEAVISWHVPFRLCVSRRCGPR